MAMQFPPSSNRATSSPLAGPHAGGSHPSPLARAQSHPRSPPLNPVRVNPKQAAQSPQNPVKQPSQPPPQSNSAQQQKKPQQNHQPKQQAPQSPVAQSGTEQAPAAGAGAGGKKSQPTTPTQKPQQAPTQQVQKLTMRDHFRMRKSREFGCFLRTWDPWKSQDDECAVTMLLRGSDLLSICQQTQRSPDSVVSRLAWHVSGALVWDQEQSKYLTRMSKAPAAPGRQEYSVFNVLNVTDPGQIERAAVNVHCYEHNLFMQNSRKFPQARAHGHQAHQAQQRQHRNMPQQGAESGGLRVLLISNLNPAKVTSEALKTLFSEYGRVERVKVLYNRQDTALVQFAVESEAQVAMRNLNGQLLFGKPVSISMSKYRQVSCTQPQNFSMAAGQPGVLLNGGPAPVSKAPPQKPMKPSNVLTVSNLPDDTTETELKELFGDEVAIDIDGEKRFATISTQATCIGIQMLMKYQNYSLRGKYLRIGFAASNLKSPESARKNPFANSSQLFDSSEGKRKRLAGAHRNGRPVPTQSQLPRAANTNTTKKVVSGGQKDKPAPTAVPPTNHHRRKS